MSCPPAQKGRHHQRYDDQFRLVAGCIPYKFDEGVHGNRHSYDPYKRLRVLMISTPNRHDLVFPKGGWEDDEDIKDAACREALEEAGVKGILSDQPLGIWEFRSKSREKNGCKAGVGGCRGHMYAMKVTQELESWPEQAIYIRKWLTVEEAFEVCRYDWMREALRRLMIHLSKVNIEEEVTKESIELPYPLFSITTYFLGFSNFLFKCGNLFTKMRSLSYLGRIEERLKKNQMDHKNLV